MTGLAMLFAGLFCAVAHWTVEILTHGKLGRLPRYLIGEVAIGLAFGGWCWLQSQPVPAIAAFLAWLSIVGGAGAGTLTAYLVDHIAGLEREARLLETRHEPPAR